MKRLKIRGKIKFTFHGRKGDQTGGKGVIIVNVLHGPLGLLLNDGHRLDSIQQEVLLAVVLDEGVNE